MPKKQNTATATESNVATLDSDLAKGRITQDEYDAKSANVQTVESLDVSKVSNIAELEKSILNLKRENEQLQSQLDRLSYNNVKNIYSTIFGRLEPKLENPSEIVKRSASLKTGKVRTTGEGDLKGLTPHEARLYVYASKVESTLYALTKLLKDGAPKA